MLTLMAVTSFAFVSGFVLCALFAVGAMADRPNGR
jgi:hypothetical protein